MRGWYGEGGRGEGMKQGMPGGTNAYPRRNYLIGIPLPCPNFDFISLKGTVSFDIFAPPAP